MPGRRAPSSLRLFVAVYPPIEAASDMLAEMAALAPPHLPPLPRALPAAQVHLTLLFVGDTDGRDLDRVRESVARSAAGLPVFTLAPRALIWLPERGTPRLIAVQTDAPPPLLELQRRLVSRLARGKAPHGRPFLPHFTLGRYAHDARPVRGEPTPASRVPPFLIPSITLMSSLLRPGGAEHAQVDRFDLAPHRC